MKIDFLGKLLKASNITKKEYNGLISEMKKDPIGFILNEKNSNKAKTKNIVKSIYQSLLPYEKQNYVIEKPELNHIKLVFMGVGGGGCVVSQRGRVSGFVIHSGIDRVHVDPGSGTVRDCEEYTQFSGENWDPILTDALVLTHNHLDHAGGLEEYVEVMTFSNMLHHEKIILGNKTVIEGNREFNQGPRIDKYNKAKRKIVRAMEPGDVQDIGGLRVKAVKATHIEAYDPITNRKADYSLGYVIESPYGVLGITGDTEYNSTLVNDFKDVDYLIAYIVQEKARAKGMPERYDKSQIEVEVPHHIQFLGEGGLEFLLKEVKPKLCLITHYGDQLASIEGGRLVYQSIPEAIAHRVEKNTGVKVLACLDGMSIDFIENFKPKLNKQYFINSNRNNTPEYNL